MTNKTPQPLSEKELREKINAEIKTQQEYVQQCTLANIQAAKTSGQWVIHDPNREYAVDRLLDIILQDRQAWGEYVIGMAPSCEPDCTTQRHAYHQGGWDLMIEQQQRNQGEKSDGTK